ncbi:sensor histidine kinase [Myroides pelagicus]|uniref:histidine kinase n=1 Tax=Myroides pelagicus TaxID=270914 RepID=A0A7K1GL95_9FLAO|nr:HAMP domain-containing sensor histidine kinase [Myroides pelagicus]MEC4112612.1 HAMP domain-containing sensor histidine kinase [Myroides pelagicus]MTH29510.1 sensor histidine kinase [Myroides pelagicus]
MNNKKEIIRWLLVTAAFFTLVVILWNTYSFFQMYKEEERIKMNIWAETTNTLYNAKLSDTSLSLSLLILTENKTIPIVQTTENDSILSFINVDEKIVNNPKKAKEYLRKLKAQNDPMEVIIGDEVQYLYYGNSSLLTKLKYYPISLVLVFLFFSILIFNFYRSHRSAMQNKLWTGMAKETAHQIGTPLSSLLGWIEIMKLENVDEQITSEIYKDVSRLQTIADRFSKIGSKPQLTLHDIVEETKKTFEYLSPRNSKQIEYTTHFPNYPILIPINKELHSWTIENLIKNAIDAMRGKGKISIQVQDTPKVVNIFITDTGSGIPKKLHSKIFEPGYTTKKRGWGLGLSLTKRIVEQFQNGKIRVHQSEIGKGTTFCITYKKPKGQH